MAWAGAEAVAGAAVEDGGRPSVQEAHYMSLARASKLSVTKHVNARNSDRAYNYIYYTLPLPVLIGWHVSPHLKTTCIRTMVTRDYR